MRRFLISWIALALACAWGQAQAQGQKLRIITWADYVPADLIAAFTKETGIEVEVTLSNNEEMISKLRATGGAGYDLAQPSQDRISSVQRDFEIYKPIDLKRVKLEEFQPALARNRQAQRHHRRQALRAALSVGNRRIGRQRQARRHGLRLHRSVPAGPQGQDLDPPAPAHPDGDSRSPMGKDPFALYGDHQGLHARSWSRSATTLIACKANFKFFYDNKDQLLNGIRSGEVWAAAMWDTGGWTLESRESRHPIHRAALGRARLARHLRAAGARPQRRRRLRLDQLHHASGERRTRHQVGRQFLGRQGHRAVRGSAPQGAVPRGVSRKRSSRTCTGIRRFRRASKRSRAACSTASRPPIERAGPGRRRASSSASRITSRSTRCRSASSAAVSSPFSGPSGCGKTTLLRMIAGFIAPDGGDILIGGTSMRDVAPNRRPVNMVFQQLALVSHDVGGRERGVRPRAPRRGPRRTRTAQQRHARARGSRRRGGQDASTSSRAASASASPSRAAWCSSRRCCCSTSRSARST